MILPNAASRLHPSPHSLLCLFLFSFLLSPSLSSSPSPVQSLPQPCHSTETPDFDTPAFALPSAHQSVLHPSCYIYLLTCSLSSRLLDLVSYNPTTAYTPRACTPHTRIHSHTHAHVPFFHVFPAAQPKIAETLNHRVQPADHSSPARPVPFYSRPAHIHASSSPRRAPSTRLS